MTYDETIEGMNKVNTIKEISQALVAIQSVLVEKMDAQPKMSVTLTVGQDDKCWIYIYGSKNYDAIYAAKGSTFAECILDANAFVSGLPNPDERVTREYLTRVASAVDYATEHSLPDEYVAPLRGVSAAMTSNLLTKETA